MKIHQPLTAGLLLVVACNQHSTRQDLEAGRVSEVIRVLESYNPELYDFQKQKRKHDGAIPVDTHGCERLQVAARILLGPDEWNIVRESPAVYFEAIRIHATNSDTRNRTDFIELLAMLGKPALEPLIQIVLSDDDRELRSLALIAACANQVLSKSEYSRKLFEDAGVSDLALAWFDYVARGDEAVQALHRSILGYRADRKKSPSRIHNLRVISYLSRIHKVETLFVLCQLLKAADIEESHFLTLIIASMLDCEVIAEGDAILHLRRGNETLAQRLEAWLWANADRLKWNESVSKYRSE